MSHLYSLKYFKDPVYGYIFLPVRLVEDVVDNPVFQRLRHIRQNSLASLVYPHIEHSRFSHSLGVGHLALEALRAITDNTRTILNQLENIAKEKSSSELFDKINGLNCLLKIIDCIKDYIVAVGLLHDIGHMPYSHVYESSLQEVDTIFGNKSETYTLEHTSMDFVSRILQLMKKLNGFHSINLNILNLLLNSAFETIPTIELAETLDKLLKRNEEDKHLNECLTNNNIECVNNPKILRYALLMLLRLVHDLFNSNLDLDRADYLLRDSIEAGTRYGLYDIERLINVLVIIPLDPRSENARHSVLGVLDKGISIVENILINRAYMYSEVYLHRITATYNSLLSRFIALLIKLSSICQYECLEILNPRRLLKNNEIQFLKLTDEYIATILNDMGVHSLDIEKNNRGYRDNIIDKCINEHNQQISINECVTLHLIPYVLSTRKHPQIYYTLGAEKTAYDNAEKNMSTIRELIKRNPLLLLWLERKSVYTREKTYKNIKYHLSIRVLLRKENSLSDRNIEDLGILRDIYDATYYRVVVISPIKLSKSRIDKNIKVKGKFDIRSHEYREISLNIFKHCLELKGIETSKLEQKFEEFINELEKDTSTLLKLLFS